MAVLLAEQLNITVCGYVRPGSLDLHTGNALDVATATPATAGE